jgi:hypothetical protein
MHEERLICDNEVYIPSTLSQDLVLLQYFNFNDISGILILDHQNILIGHTGSSKLTIL